MTGQLNPAPLRPRVLLVGWDGADWNFLRPLCEKGVMPALTHLAQNGVAGELASLPPYLSPMLWNSIATGKRPWRHGIHGFTEVDAQGSVRPISSRSRRVPALWNILSSQARRTHVVGWFASHPAEVINGVCVSEAFFQKSPAPRRGQESSAPTASALAGMVSPADLAEELAGLRVTAESLDTDLLRLLIPGATTELAAHDPRIMRLAERLAELYSVHNVTASLLETEPWDFAAVYFHFVDWVLHDFASFVPPRQPGVSRSAFDRFHGVVEGACRLQDVLLADLLKIAGPDTLVFLVSDHGFATGAEWQAAPNVPAGIAAQHRPLGIFTAHGPGLRHGMILPGASLLDVTPTILHACGLPVGEDMDGRALTEIFASPQTVAFIPSWDEATSPPTKSPPAESGASINDQDDSALLERFVQLGYVDAAVLNDPEAAEMQRIHNGWNAGMDLLDAGRPREALPLLEGAAWAQPELAHFTFWLARCQARLGLAEEARATMRLLDDFGDAMPRVHQLKGMVALESGQAGAALGHFDCAAARGETSPNLATWKAIALQQTGKWLEAFELLKPEVTRGPLPETWLAIARCYLWAGRPRGAIFACRHAVARHPRYVAAHLTLAQALFAAGKKDDAWSAFTNARRLKPEADDVGLIGTKLFPDRIVPTERRSNERSDAPSELLALRAAISERQKAWHRHLDEKRQRQHPVYEVGKPETPASSGKSFVIVSGLPRSGTSLLMQMLREGGLAPMTDDHRLPDIHNPQGFFEWEPVRRLPLDPDLIEQVEGRALKVISALVPHLPRKHAYQVLAMVRHPGEIARSQAKMLAHSNANLEAVTAKLEQHQADWLAYLRNSPNVELLELQFTEVVAQPGQAAQAIGKFLGPERLPHPALMPRAVNPALYRNRHSEVT